MKAKKKKSNGKVVYGRDGRKMHENSLANTKSNSFKGARIKPGQTRNPHGRPLAPEKFFRNELLKILKEPSQTKRETRLQELIDEAIKRMKRTDSDDTYLRFLQMFESSLDEKIDQKQSNYNAITAQNVIFLPNKNEEPIPAQLISAETTQETDE